MHSDFVEALEREEMRRKDEPDEVCYRVFTYYSAIPDHQHRMDSCDAASGTVGSAPVAVDHFTAVPSSLSLGAACPHLFSDGLILVTRLALEPPSSNPLSRTSFLACQESGPRSTTAHRQRRCSLRLHRNTIRLLTASPQSKYYRSLAYAGAATDTSGKVSYQKYRNTSSLACYAVHSLSFRY